MRTITTTVYHYEELSDEAKKKAIEECRYGIAQIADEGDNDEYQSCLDKMEAVFGIDVHGWEVDAYRHYYRFTVTSERWCDHEDKPRLLLRYINDIWFDLYKGKYYGNLYKDDKGEWVHKKRYSKVLRELSCPLTGTWTDYAAEKAMENAYKRVRENWTIRDFIDDMLNTFFTCWEDDMYHHLSDEYVEESIIANEYEFTEDGKRY